MQLPQQESQGQQTERFPLKPSAAPFHALRLKPRATASRKKERSVLTYGAKLPARSFCCSSFRRAYKGIEGENGYSIIKKKSALQEELPTVHLGKKSRSRKIGAGLKSVPLLWLVLD